VVTTIDLGLTSDTTVTYGAAYDATVTTVNETTSTGAVTTDVSPLLAITSVTLGATGNDTLTDSLAAAKTASAITYNMGGGNDTFNINLDNGNALNIATVINLGTGTGHDAVNVSAVSGIIDNIVVAPTSANFMNGFTTINNFSTTLDTLTLPTAAGTNHTVIATNAQQGLITAAPNLLAALGLAEGDIGAHTAGIYFSYTTGATTSTYILEHNAAVADTALTAGDGVIAIVGVAATALNPTNFVHA
jgi:hypothetical protein